MEICKKRSRMNSEKNDAAKKGGCVDGKHH